MIQTLGAVFVGTKKTGHSHLHVLVRTRFLLFGCSKNIFFLAIDLKALPNSKGFNKYPEDLGNVSKTSLFVIFKAFQLSNVKGIILGLEILMDIF